MKLLLLATLAFVAFSQTIVGPIHLASSNTWWAIVPVSTLGCNSWSGCRTALAGSYLQHQSMTTYNQNPTSNAAPVLRGYLGHPKIGGTSLTNSDIAQLGNLWPSNTAQAFVGVQWPVAGTYTGTPSWTYVDGPDDGTLLTSLQQDTMTNNGLWINLPGTPSAPPACAVMKKTGLSVITAGCGATVSTITHVLVQYVDVENPVFTCPAGQTIHVQRSTDPNHVYEAPSFYDQQLQGLGFSLSDNAGVDQSASGYPQVSAVVVSTGQDGHFTVTYSATDAAGNTAIPCVTNMVAFDISAPHFSPACPSSITVQAPVPAGTVRALVSAVDDGDGVLTGSSIVCVGDSGYPTTTQTVSVTCTATNADGLQSAVGSCVVQVNILGGVVNYAPVCTNCPASAPTYTIEATLLDATPFTVPAPVCHDLNGAVAATVSINGGSSLTSAPGVWDIRGDHGNPYTLVWTATNDQGTTVCQAQVVIQDTTSTPTITCPTGPIPIDSEAGSSTGTLAIVAAVDDPIYGPQTAICTAADIPQPVPNIWPLGTTLVKCSYTNPSHLHAECITSISVAVRVLIDIRPGYCPNLVKHPSASLLPVAILGTPTFDVNQIVQSSLMLGGVPANAYGIVKEDRTCPFPTKEHPWWAQQYPEFRCMYKCKDKHIDLIVYFNQSAIAENLHITTCLEFVYLTLTGQLMDGTPFHGTDLAIITGYASPPHHKWHSLNGRHDFDDTDDDDDKDTCYGDFSRKNRKNQRPPWWKKDD